MNAASTTQKSTRTRTSTPRRLAWLGLLAVFALLLATGCSGTDVGGANDAGASAADESFGDSDTASMDSMGSESEPAAAPGERGGATSAGDAGAGDPGATPSIIATGTVTLAAEDVAGTIAKVQQVVDRVGGRVTDSETTAAPDDTDVTDADRAHLEYGRMVLRVPSDDFDAVVTDVGELGELLSSTTQTKDVGGEIVDVQARIRAQEASLERVELLFSRAQNIRTIMMIEGQLSRRQADLDALKSRLAWLQDQTSMSTLTVHVERPADAHETDTSEHTAFVEGLLGGWNAVKDVGSSLALALGAALPLLLALLVLGAPLWLLVRRHLPSVRRGLARPSPATDEPTAG